MSDSRSEASVSPQPQFDGFVKALKDRWRAAQGELDAEPDGCPCGYCQRLRAELTGLYLGMLAVNQLKAALSASPDESHAQRGSGTDVQSLPARDERTNLVSRLVDLSVSWRMAASQLRNPKRQRTREKRPDEIFDACAFALTETLDELAALSASPVSIPPAPTQEWQDISTAPKDGTHVLVTDGTHVCEMRWDEGAWYELNNHHTDAWGRPWYEGEATHWMPLPSAPATGESEP